jgi:hypothetical protein
MNQSMPTSKLKFGGEVGDRSLAPWLIDAFRRAASDPARLARNIGRACLTHISNQQVSEDWMTCAIAEAEEELRRQASR